MFMLTPFGQEIRRLRIEHSHLLYDMAQYLGYQSSYLSSIETGKVPVPTDMISRIAEWYQLDAAEVAKLQNLARFADVF